MNQVAIGLSVILLCILQLKTPAYAQKEYIYAAVSESVLDFQYTSIKSHFSGTRDICVGTTGTIPHTSTGGRWTSGNTSVVTIDAVTGVLTATGTGTTDVTYTVTNAAGEESHDITTVTVHALPAITAITGPAAVCLGQQVTLTNTTPGGVWSSGDNAIATIDAHGVLTTVDDGIADIAYTVTNAFGCSSTTHAKINISFPPQAVISYAKKTYCLVGTAEVVQDGTDGGTFSAGRGLVIDARTGTINLAGSTPGTYTVTYAFNDGVCSNTAVTEVIVEGNPVIAPITGNHYVCLGSTTRLNNLTAGGVWSSNDNTTVGIAADGLANGVKVGSAAVAYRVTSVNGCTSSVEHMLQVPELEGFTMSSTKVSCSGWKDGTITIAKTGRERYYSINDVVWETENVFTGLPAGDYTVQVINTAGCKSRKQVITVESPSAIGMTIVPSNITCHGESSGALSLTVNGGTPPYRIAWSTGASGSRISNLDAGDYSVAVTDYNGCTSSMKVQLIELFPAFSVNEPVKLEGGLVNITGSAMPNAEIQVTYPDGTFTTTRTDNKGNFSTLSPGAVTKGSIAITVRDPVSRGFCRKYLEYNYSPNADLSITKTVLAPPEPVVRDAVSFTITVSNKGLDNATQVIMTDDILDNLEQIGNITVTKGRANYNLSIRQLLWSIDTLKVHETAQLTFSARIAKGGLLENTAVVSAKELDVDYSNNTASVTAVDVSPDLFIPNVVTANGDGKNDYFMIRGIDQYPGSILEIYNRWGNQVYRSLNYSNSWDGTGLTAGIYYYVLKVSMSRAVKVYKGYIELIKK
jgi:gliding motility-associated-like protein/uncharacterized repeat protein (TIGR01451 family)